MWHLQATEKRFFLVKKLSTEPTLPHVTSTSLATTSNSDLTTAFHIISINRSAGLVKFVAGIQHSQQRHLMQNNSDNNQNINEKQYNRHILKSQLNTDGVLKQSEIVFFVGEQLIHIWSHWYTAVSMCRRRWLRVVQTRLTYATRQTRLVSYQMTTQHWRVVMMYQVAQCSTVTQGHCEVLHLTPTQIDCMRHQHTDTESEWDTHRQTERLHETSTHRHTETESEWDTHRHR